MALDLQLASEHRAGLFSGDTMLRRPTFWLLCAVAFPVALSAQGPALQDSPVTQSVPVLAPVAPDVASPAPSAASVSVTAAGVAALREVRAERAARTAPPQMAGGKSFGRPEALMIIGVAGIVGGSLVGGTGGYIVSLAGLGIGLYGLYLFLQ
jgi:hypothetical protein